MIFVQLLLKAPLSFVLARHCLVKGRAKMKTKKIAFIGAGNMASSLMGGLIADGYDPQAIWASQPYAEGLEALKQRFGINTSTDNNVAAESADVVIFAVKPQILMQVAKELAPVLCRQRPLVISIAAGVREQALQRLLGNDLAIVRCMPNTPSLVGSGACGQNNRPVSAPNLFHIRC